MIVRPPEALAFDGGPRPLVAGSVAAAAWGETLSSASALGVRDLDLLDMPTLPAAVARAREAFGTDWDEVRLFLPAEAAGREFLAERPPREVVALEREEASAPGKLPSASVGRHYLRLETAEAGAASGPSPPPSWVAFPAHMLRGGRAVRTVEAWRALGARVLLRDPLAGGRLAGAPESWDPRSPARGPAPLTELEASWRPVLQLAFLTQRPGRTLPRSAVAFAWAVGATPSVRFRDPGDLADWLKGLGPGELSAADLDRIRRLPDADDPAAADGAARFVPTSRSGFK
jgi:hypothetical protein